MLFIKKAIYLVFAIGLIQPVNAQKLTLELASMLPLSGNNSLTGIGKGASIGYQTQVSYNVRVRANFEIQFFNGNKNTLVNYGTHYEWPSTSITYPINNSISKMRYSEFSIGYDYFLFRSFPNMYFGPDLFAAQSTAFYKSVSDYENTDRKSVV